MALLNTLMGASRLRYRPNGLAYLAIATSPSVRVDAAEASPTTEPQLEALTSAGTTDPAISTQQQAAERDWRPEGLYVGAVNVTADRLASDFYLELTISGFNASGSAITIDAQGRIGLRVASATTEAGIPELTPPRICRERMGSEDVIPNLSAILLLLEQRLPREVAQSVIEALDAGGRIHLDLERLEVIAKNVDDPTYKARLPIWQQVTVLQVPKHLLAVRAAKAGARATVR